MSDPSAIDEPIPSHDRNIRTWKEFVLKLMKEEPHQVLVAADGNELVGYIMLQNEVKPPIEFAHESSLVSDLYVRSSYRRQGIAKKLLQSCLDSLRKRGITRVELRVWCRNKNAIALYRQLGFEDRMITMRLMLWPPSGI